MKDLIEALQIFAKYVNPYAPTNCVHDELCIMEVHKNQLNEQEQNRVEELGFFWDEYDEAYKSFRFGSA